MAAPGANPRKFAEKIAQHVQKGAEEEAEFRKIMAELAAVKQGDRVSDMASPHYSLIKGVPMQSFLSSGAKKCILSSTNFCGVIQNN